jgi:hypothetical protein
MAKAERWLTDPKTGGYCTITLDNGEKIVVNHEKGQSKAGWLTIERLKFLGFRSDRLFACNLDSQEARTALSFLSRDAPQRGLDATPLGAFVKHLRTCASVAEVKARCTALIAMHRATEK